MRSFIISTFTSTVVVASMLISLVSEAQFKPNPKRGSPSEYDPGPPKDSEWAKLFGQAPNYRLIGKEVLAGGSEKFRWQWGPMWYRGRLNRNEVKVFVVGQEGAQDENVSNRAFTGSTGTKTQKLLNYMGIYESYLFMNTFVYTINGQLEDDPKFVWLEQGRSKSRGRRASCFQSAPAGVECGSPIVDYRHALFDYMASTNNGKKEDGTKDTKPGLNVILGVGTGGKASTATWVNHVVGEDVCDPASNMKSCNTPANRAKIHAAFNEEFGTSFSESNPLLIVGVPHPGGASPNNGGLEALQNIVRGFTSAATSVSNEMEKNSKWLQADAQETRSRDQIAKELKQEYRYGNAPVPFKDFAFGTNWRMGAEGTTSNRRGADSIQVFSDDGKYNNDGHTVRYESTSDDVSGLETSGGETRVPGMKSFDLAYEPPRFDPKDPNHSKQYDYGPCGENSRNEPTNTCELAKLLQDWPDMSKLGVAKPISHPSFGNGMIYRGDLEGSELLVLADQLSHDDFFSTRALTGLPGQRIQKFLEVANAEGNYGILRTLPVDTLDEKGNVNEALALNEKVIQKRDAILDSFMGNKKVVVVVGKTAKKVWEAYAETLQEPPFAIFLDPISKSNVVDWDKAADVVSKKLGKGESSGSIAVAGNPVAKPIPRVDLPIHSRWWMGTSGSRTVRGTCTAGCEDTLGNYYQADAPKWATRLRPRKSTSDSEEIKRILSVAPSDAGRSGSDVLSNKWDGRDEDTFEFYEFRKPEGITVEDLVDIENKIVEKIVGIDGRSSASKSDKNEVFYDDYLVTDIPKKGTVTDELGEEWEIELND